MLANLIYYKIIWCINSFGMEDEAKIVSVLWISHVVTNIVIHLSLHETWNLESSLLGNKEKLLICLTVFSNLQILSWDCSLVRFLVGLMGPANSPKPWTPKSRSRDLLMGALSKLVKQATRTYLHSHLHLPPHIPWVPSTWTMTWHWCGLTRSDWQPQFCEFVIPSVDVAIALTSQAHRLNPITEYRKLLCFWPRCYVSKQCL